MAGSNPESLLGDADLFPRKLSITAAVLAGALVAGVVLLVARSARFSSLAVKFPTDAFVGRTADIVAAVKKGELARAAALQRAPAYRQLGDDFTAALGDLTERLSQARDEQLARQLKLIRAVVACFVAVFILLVALFQRIYASYRAHFRARVEAERQILLLSQGRKALIHVLCHDLGNPVASITGLIGFVEKFEGEQRAQAIAMIKRAAAGAQGIIDLIRKLQALESGKLALDLGDHELAALVRESVEVLGERLAMKKLKLVVDVDPALRVRVEKTSFVSSVVNNVLSNAIKFSKEGDAIEIRARAREAGVDLSVRDHGVGMPPELVDSVFSELKATSRAGTSGEKGTGFGMPLARKFVVAYGGDIAVKSSEAPGDHGTEITLKLKKRLSPGCCATSGAWVFRYHCSPSSSDTPSG
ncbi:MAG: HAMP domain-containing histidine kinase, partial [Deltaproteobacteria bacterium]|nr:HAMP domain-containing histidine kinase [Deltaproteobacteria bacterium]